MPYGRYRRKRYSRNRRRSSRNVSWLDKKYSTKDIAMSAYKSAKWLASMVNVEKKLLDTALSTAADATGFINHLTPVAQGDTISNRNGNSIKLVSGHLYGSIRWSGVATDTELKMLLLRDNQQVGDTAPAVTDVLPTPSPNDFLNASTLGRFTILAEKRWMMKNVNSASARVPIDFKFKFNHHVRYNGTTASDIQKGGLYVLFVSNEVTNYPTVGAQMRIRFVDN